jgi:hypothetical protein
MKSEGGGRYRCPKRDDASDIKGLHPDPQSIILWECVVNPDADSNLRNNVILCTFPLIFDLIEANIMKPIAFSTVVFAYLTTIALGFAPAPLSQSVRLQVRSSESTPPLTRTFINIGDQERERLTRDSEPGDYFKTCVRIVMQQSPFCPCSIAYHV